MTRSAARRVFQCGGPWRTPRRRSALRSAGHGTEDRWGVRKNLEVSLAQRIAKDQLKREPLWTESLAVGSAAFLQKIEPQVSSRRETEIVGTADNAWALQESPIPYGQRNRPENRAIDLELT